MSKILRISILLLSLGITVAAYFLLRDSYPTLATKTRPAVIAKPASPAMLALRRSNFAELDTLFASVEAAAETDGDAERRLHLMLNDFGYASEEDRKQMDIWATEGGHHAQLALSRFHRVRGYLTRGDAYASKIDPVRMTRFRTQSRQAYVHAEQATLTHPNCGVAYGLMLDALVGISDRREIDAVFQRSQKAAAQWRSPLFSYLYALHPNWYGKPGERKQVIERFAQQNPDHDALKGIQAYEEVRLADLAIGDHKYGEGMILADYALEKAPNNASAWESKGRAFRGVQRAPDALQAFDKSIELDPFNATAYRQRGQLRLIMDNAAGQEDLVQAAMLGDTWALKQALWNWLTGNTTGVAKDMSRIPELCERASQAGIPDGVFCVATMHYFGYGVPQDMKKGVELMRAAADIGVSDAMSDVGKILWTGNAAAGITQDKEQAVRYWIRAAAIDNDRALVEISQIKNDPELMALVQKIVNEKP